MSDHLPRSALLTTLGILAATAVVLLALHALLLLETPPARSLRDFYEYSSSVTSRKRIGIVTDLIVPGFVMGVLFVRMVTPRGYRSCFIFSLVSGIGLASLQFAYQQVLQLQMSWLQPNVRNVAIDSIIAGAFCYFACWGVLRDPIRRAVRKHREKQTKRSAHQALSDK